MDLESRVPFETEPTALETAPAPLEVRPSRGVSLFWRTFFFLTLLLVGCIVAWLQTFRALEYEPRALQSAQQLASLVNLSRAALVHSDSIARVSLIKTLAAEEGLRIAPREPSDTFKLYNVDVLSRNVAERLSARLGPTPWWRARSMTSPACGSASASTATRTGCSPIPRASGRWPAPPG